MSATILTIGYANRSIENLIALLQRDSVQFLIDVRSNPLSRPRPEFSREPLEAAARLAGIRYIFMGDSLGGRPRDQSCYKNGHVIYSLVQEKSFFRAGIDRLLDASAKDVRVCLLCSENRPEDCHRSKMIGVSLAARGANVIHIGHNGDHEAQAEVMARVEAQPDLFDNTLHSRKAYGTA